MRLARFLSLVVVVVGIGAMACGGDSSSGGGGGGLNHGGNDGSSNSCTPSSRPGKIHGSCMNDTWLCADYSGSAAYQGGATIKTACEMLSGVYSSEPCEISASNYLGGCLSECGRPAETALRIFDDGSMFANLDLQREACIARNQTWLEK